MVYFSDLLIAMHAKGLYFLFYSTSESLFMI